MGEVVELEVPARADYLAIIRLVVTAFAHLHPEYDDDQVDDLRLAVSEACANSIEAYQRDGGRDRVPVVRVAFAIATDRIEITITDSAGGFDPANLAVHPPVTDPERLDFERGLGIPLIRALTDEAEFESSPSGTTVRLVVRGEEA